MPNLIYNNKTYEYEFVVKMEGGDSKLRPRAKPETFGFFHRNPFISWDKSPSHLSSAKQLSYIRT